MDHLVGFFRTGSVPVISWQAFGKGKFEEVLCSKKLVEETDMVIISLGLIVLVYVDDWKNSWEELDVLKTNCLLAWVDFKA